MQLLQGRINQLLPYWWLHWTQRYALNKQGDDVRPEINCITGSGGGLSEHIVVPKYAVFKLPDHIPMQVGGNCILNQEIYS